jgi:hypothetical protein
MAYKFGLVNGAPQFTYAGQTAMVFAGKGAPRVTSLNGQPGTGIVSGPALPLSSNELTFLPGVDLGRKSGPPSL